MQDKIAGKTPDEWVQFLKDENAPKKLINQIKAIENSGKKYGRSKEYIMRTMLNSIPDKYLDNPTCAEKNKKSFELSEDNYRKIEAVLSNIAKHNSIEHVTDIDLHITNTDCVAKFSCEKSKKIKNKKVQDNAE